MTRQFFAIHGNAATVLGGNGLGVVLSAGLVGWGPILLAAGCGVLLAAPVAWFAARRVAEL